MRRQRRRHRNRCRSRCEAPDLIQRLAKDVPPSSDPCENRRWPATVAARQNGTLRRFPLRLDGNRIALCGRPQLMSPVRVRGGSGLFGKGEFRALRASLHAE
jgi:hypothetical protein